jgi:putative membrane protein
MISLLIRKIFFICLAFYFFLSCTKNNSSGSPINTNSTDKVFLAASALSNVYETTLAPLAIAKAKNTGVSAYGQLILDTIRLASSELSTIADSLTIPIVTTTDAFIDAKKDSLSNLTGISFDSAYIASQIDEQQKTIIEFESEVKQGVNRLLINYANKWLPIYQHHLDLADSLMQVIIQTR